VNTAPLDTIRDWLARKTGLSSESLGDGWLSDLLEQRRRLLGCEDLVRYSGKLFLSYEEQDFLIQSTLVHESWFFREPAAFLELRRTVTELATQGRSWRLRPYRVLSLPCAAGEEPYSIAMDLLEAGLRRGEFQIEAADLSQRAVARAKEGRYRAVSVRGTPVRHFQDFVTPTEEGFEVKAEIRDSVHYQVDNAVSPRVVSRLPAFDAIFCRNLLVYLTAAAREQVLTGLLEMLEPEGRLFFGHADLDPVLLSRLERVGEAGSFAYRVRRASREAAHSLPPVSRPMRRVPRTLPARKTVATSATKPAVEPRGSWMTAPTFEEAEALANRGQTGEAILALKAVLEQSPLLGQAWMMLGTLQWTMEERSEAEAAFRKALYLDPTDENGLLHLALLLEETGRVDEAARLRQRLGRRKEASA